MNHEEIIERLLDEKHITAKEAVCLLDKCRETVKYQYFPEYPCQSCPY